MSSAHVAMTTSSASAVIEGQRNVTMPAPMPVTPQKATQPRWTSRGRRSRPTAR